MEPVAGRCAKLDEWALVPGIDLTLIQGARCYTYYVVDAGGLRDTKMGIG